MKEGNITFQGHNEASVGGEVLQWDPWEGQLQWEGKKKGQKVEQELVPVHGIGPEQVSILDVRAEHKAVNLAVRQQSDVNRKTSECQTDSAEVGSSFLLLITSSSCREWILTGTCLTRQIQRHRPGVAQTGGKGGLQMPSSRWDERNVLSS